MQFWTDAISTNLCNLMTKNDVKWTSWLCTYSAFDLYEFIPFVMIKYLKPAASLVEWPDELTIMPFAGIYFKTLIVYHNLYNLMA